MDYENMPDLSYGKALVFVDATKGKVVKIGKRTLIIEGTTVYNGELAVYGDPVDCWPSLIMFSSEEGKLIQAGVYDDNFDKRSEADDSTKVRNKRRKGKQ